MRSFSRASLCSLAVSIAAAAWFAKRERRRASVGVKSSTRPSRDSLSATARTPSRRPATEISTASILSHETAVPAVSPDAARL